jgi:hypothetical protein
LAEPKPALKLKLFEALSEAFPDGEVTVKDYSPGHPKLAARRIIHAQVGARILFKDENQESYAVAAMIPATSSDNEIAELIARMADDKRRTEVTMTPGRAF